MSLNVQMYNTNHSPPPRNLTVKWTQPLGGYLISRGPASIIGMVPCDFVYIVNSVKNKIVSENEPYLNVNTVPPIPSPLPYTQ